MVAKFRESLAMSEQTTHRFHVESFNLEKLNKAECKEQYRHQVSKWFAALENLETEMDVNKAWETISENINFCQRESKLL
jgi:hypothetical protein